MLFHLIETGRHRAWHFASTLWSTSAHAALVSSVVAGALTATGADDQPEPQREVVYLLPALPSAPAMPSDGQVSFRGEDFGLRERSGVGAPTNVAGRDLPADASIQAVRAPVVPVVLDSVTQSGSAVFVAADLDRLVERDPTSAAPTYPADMERQSVEGAVQAEWVVDSAGVADTTTFRVVAATHPQFVAAVRGALPLMRFRPAELLGKHVAQLVRQEFAFRLRLAADSAR